MDHGAGAFVVLALLTAAPFGASGQPGAGAPLEVGAALAAAAGETALGADWTLWTSGDLLVGLRHRDTLDRPDVLAAVRIPDASVAWAREDADGGFIPVALLDNVDPPLLLARDGITVWRDEVHAFVPRLRGIDLSTGRDRWETFSIRPLAMRVLAGTATTVVIAAQDGWESLAAYDLAIVALDVMDGSVRYRLDRPRGSADDSLRWVALEDRFVLVLEDEIRTVATDTGAVAWSGDVDPIVEIVATDQVVVVRDGAGLSAYDADDGAVAWRREGEWAFLVAAAGGIAALQVPETGGPEVHVLAPADGSTRCRRLAGWHAFAWQPWMDACDGGATATEVTVAGTLLVDGVPRAGVHVEVHGRPVVTDDLGRFEVALDALGEVGVGPDVRDLGQDPALPCVEARGVIVEAVEAGARYEVVLEAAERPALCEWGCSPVDCE